MNYNMSLYLVCVLLMSTSEDVFSIGEKQGGRFSALLSSLSASICICLVKTGFDRRFVLDAYPFATLLRSRDVYGILGDFFIGHCSRLQFLLNMDFVCRKKHCMHLLSPRFSKEQINTSAKSATASPMLIRYHLLCSLLCVLCLSI
jgi:hypothetical protein